MFLFNQIAVFNFFFFKITDNNTLFIDKMHFFAQTRSFKSQENKILILQKNDNSTSNIDKKHVFEKKVSVYFD